VLNCPASVVGAGHRSTGPAIFDLDQVIGMPFQREEQQAKRSCTNRKGSGEAWEQVAELTCATGG
jgi:hypothetical protein